MLAYAPGHPFVVGLHFAFVSEHSSYTPPTSPPSPTTRAVSQHSLHSVLDS